MTGVPQVACSEDAVTFTVRSRNPFTGNIYIKGKFNDPTCRQEFFSNSFSGAQLTVRIPQCGMRRIRQAFFNFVFPMHIVLTYLL